MSPEPLRSTPVSTHEAPEDLAAFWAKGLPGAVEPRLEPVRTHLRTLDVRDVTFAGFDGQPVRAWLVTPAGASADLPVVVEFMGYGGGRALPTERLLYASAGYAHLAVDTRGQGGGWAVGDTADPHDGEPSSGAFVTRGIADRETYYYRRVFTDAACAVRAAHVLPVADPDRVAVAGTSQGGGMAIAAAAISELTGGPRVTGAMVDVPFLCDVLRAVTLAETPPYADLRRFLAVRRDLVPAATETLRYHDGVVLAGAASVPSLWSVALQDPTCPPETVFAAYDAWAGDKSIEVYPFNEHEGGGAHHAVARLDFLAELFG